MYVQKLSTGRDIKISVITVEYRNHHYFLKEHNFTMNYQ